MDKQLVQSALKIIKDARESGDIHESTQQYSDKLIENFDEYYPVIVEVYLTGAGNIGKDLHQELADKLKVTRIEAKHMAMQVLVLTVPYIKHISCIEQDGQ